MGKLIIPGGPSKFYDEITAITKARWIGPSRGTVDPLKEANARNIDEAALRKSPQEHILEDGGDYIEILDEIKEFRDGVDERKLSPPNYNVKADTSGDSAESEGGGDNSADGDNDGIPNEAEKKKAKPKGGPAQ
jgi:capsid protein